MSKIKVTNRGAGLVVYKVQLDNGNMLRREFTAGQTREIEEEEIERLTYTPGGRELIMNYLLIQNDALVKEIAHKVEPEYWMTEVEIIKLLKSGTMDEFLDCLDFAPEGVLDLLKKHAVELPLNDVAKREAIMQKTGFDVSKALSLKAESETEDTSNSDSTAARRTNPARRSNPKYKTTVEKE